MCKIGVLSLQGSVAEHLACIENAGARPVPVKTRNTLGNVDALILPGGESTTLGILLREFGLTEPLRNSIGDGLPVWGTCAGMILLAKQIEGQETCHLGVMDIAVRRNGYGSQLNSFTARAVILEVSQDPMPLVFIRAPYIEKTWGSTQEMLTMNGRLVAARQGHMLATAFHPELTGDLSFYRYFIDKIVK
ncbi:MAG: pyridoxal 5'-phosphate synthase glutaminase subunit PdxT [Bacillota bacterium]